MKNKFLIILLFSIMLFMTKHAYAEQINAGSSALLTDATVQSGTTDVRGKELQAYLNKHNSPLASSAATFIKEADTYSLDWKLVAAISGVESGYGLQIPTYSYNAWGWGVYGANVHRFTSWDDAIHTISKGLKENYVDRGATTIYSIGHIYASDAGWAYKVQRNMDDIAAFATTTKNASLSISL